MRTDSIKKPKVLIFDFDGTIADTKTIYYDSIYHLVKHFDIRYEDVDKAIDLGLSLRKTLNKLGFGFIVSKFMKRRILKDIKERIEDVKKCKDVDKIKKIRLRKVIVSNSLKEFVLPVLRHLKLRKTFDEIYGAENFSGQEKENFIKSYLENKDISPKECFYIGDRAADVKLAKKVKCISVVLAGRCAWDSKKEILKEKPDFIVDNYSGLIKILKTKNNKH